MNRGDLMRLLRQEINLFDKRVDDPLWNSEALVNIDMRVDPVLHAECGLESVGYQLAKHRCLHAMGVVDRPTAPNELIRDAWILWHEKRQHVVHACLRGQRRSES